MPAGENQRAVRLEIADAVGIPSAIAVQSAANMFDPAPQYRVLARVGDLITADLFWSET